MNWVGGEVFQVKDLVSVIKAARDDFEKEKSATKRITEYDEKRNVLEQLLGNMQPRKESRPLFRVLEKECLGLALIKFPVWLLKRCLEQNIFFDELRASFSTVIEKSDKGRNLITVERLAFDHVQF